jgi:hypothetical protein
MFTVPGDGDIAFAPVFEALADVGYDKWVIVEAEQDPAKADPKKYAEIGFRHVTSGLAAAFHTRKLEKSMSELRVRSSEPASDGCVLSVTPASAGWSYVGFAVHKLAAGESFEKPASDLEACLVILSGRATITAGDAAY